MRIHVLGSAAGGGFPQWNCNCRNCERVRAGDALQPRTQSSIAVSDDGERWVLINASPDIRQQINATPMLQPSQGTRGTGICAVMLTDAQIDHVTGLLILREGTRLPVFCTEPVYQDLTTGFPVLSMLRHYCGITWQPMAPNESGMKIAGVPGLRFTVVPLESKAPPYSPHRDDPHPGDNVGLLVEDDRTGKRLFYAPGLGSVSPTVAEWLKNADCVLVDGTFWHSDEMARTGAGSKAAEDMGHLPISGAGGIREWLSASSAERKVLIHINNTNPILDGRSAEYTALREEGVEVAYDGMDIEL